MFPLHCQTKDGIPFVIRECEESDAARAIQFVKQIGDESDFLTFSGSDFNVSVEEEAENFKKHKESPNQIFLLAETDTEMIGLMSLEASPKPRLRHQGEFGISVKKAYWGKSVGAQMIQSMIDWAKAGGIIRKINLLVRQDNVRAQGLYKKLGFEQEGLIRRDLFTKGQFYDAYFMGMLI
ncbi:MAG: GNAT family N-acetyltransferase [Saprospiraceae bacterium]|nr:GNAT family N-acetyltransferase [Saprospiraceae bacterium]